jgi:hypothetical protein
MTTPDKHKAVSNNQQIMDRLYSNALAQLVSNSVNKDPITSHNAEPLVQPPSVGVIALTESVELL